MQQLRAVWQAAWQEHTDGHTTCSDPQRRRQLPGSGLSRGPGDSRPASRHQRSKSGQQSPRKLHNPSHRHSPLPPTPPHWLRQEPLTAPRTAPRTAPLTAPLTATGFAMASKGSGECFAYNAAVKPLGCGRETMGLEVEGAEMVSHAPRSQCTGPVSEPCIARPAWHRPRHSMLKVIPSTHTGPRGKSASCTPVRIRGSVAEDPCRQPQAPRPALKMARYKVANFGFCLGRGWLNAGSDGPAGTEGGVEVEVDRVDRGEHTATASAQQSPVWRQEESQ